MTMTSIQPLSAIAHAASEGRASGDDGEPSQVPAAADVPMEVRLDFAALLTEAERHALPRPDGQFGQFPEIPAMLYAVWRIRIDLNRAFDLSTDTGQAGLWLWAIRDGRREIDVLRTALATARSTLVGSVSFSGDRRLPVSFPWVAAMLWCSRPDLQQSYPMTDAPSQAGYLGWFLRNGVFELRCGDLLPDDHVALLAGPGEVSVGPPLTRYLEFIHAVREDIRSMFDIDAFDGRRAFIKWFFEHGVTEFPTHPGVLESQTRIVFEWGNALKQAGAGTSPEVAN